MHPILLATLQFLGAQEQKEILTTPTVEITLIYAIFEIKD